MSKFYFAEPEVSGGLGSKTKGDFNTHPPQISSLDYVFEGWLGDSLIEAFPCYLVTKALQLRIQSAALSGVTFASATTSISSQFRELNPDVKLPVFVWMKISGIAGKDDFGMSPEHILVISSTAHELLKAEGTNYCEFSLYES
jgi:hypothetical protein